LPGPGGDAPPWVANPKYWARILGSSEERCGRPRRF
jgi:hypothetical protein